MAVDKLVDSTQLDADLTSVANAIRTKGGTSAQMAFPAGFVSAVNAIPTVDWESNTPVAEATITSVTESGNDRSFDVTLSRTITKGVVLFEADAATEAAIRTDTSTTYYNISFFAMYPVTGSASGSTTLAKNVNAIAYRGSTSTAYIRSVQANQFDIAVNGTTMTVTWNGSIVGNFFPSGTYKVTVWEVADS